MEKIYVLFEQHSYGIVFGAVLLEMMGLPLPSEIAFLIAGAIAWPDRIRIASIVLVGTSAAVIADGMMFLLGRRVTQTHERWAVELYCRWTYCTLGSSRCHQQARGYIEGFRGRALLASKFLFGVRQFIPPVAGMARVRPAHFLALDAAGSLAWAAVFTVLGPFMRGQLQPFISGFRHFSLFVSILVAAGFGAIFIHKLYRFRRYGAVEVGTVENDRTGV